MVRGDYLALDLAIDLHRSKSQITILFGELTLKSGCSFEYKLASARRGSTRRHAIQPTFNVRYNENLQNYGE
jgi:hypothetical protein